MWGCCKPCPSALGPPLRMQPFCCGKLMGKTVPRHRGSCHPRLLTLPLRTKHSFSCILRRHICPSCPLLLQPLLPYLLMSLASLTLSLSLRHSVCPQSLPLPPLSWLLPKACAPTLHAWINLPISLNPWGEEQEEPAKGRQQPQFPEGSCFKPARPGRAEAKNFSLTLRAGYLV